MAIAEVDGEPLRARLGQRRTDDTARVEGCGDPLALGTGSHTVDPAPALVVDSLDLTDASAEEPAPLDSVPAVETWRGSATDLSIDVPASEEPFMLVVAESHDARWTAEAAGESLGRPVVTDGFALGWWVEPGPARTIHVRYGPQRLYAVSLALSLLGAVGCLAAVAVAGVRRMTSPRAEADQGPGEVP